MSDARTVSAKQARSLAVCAILPYLAWMLLMAALPSNAVGYAIRTAATLAAGAASFFVWNALRASFPGLRVRFSMKSLAAGVLGGLAVWAIWVLPENSEIYRRLFIIGGATAAEQSPYDPAVCGWPLTIVRLFGSAFVIAAAEEVFFRGFLYRWIAGKDWKDAASARFDLQAFLWTAALFALEHNRWLAAAIAGAAYSMLSIRCGLLSAIVAHVTTNLALGLQVVLRADWGFW